VSLDLKPVQVRLSDDAYAALRMLAEIEGKDLGEKGREILTRALLGDAHVAKVQIERLTRAVKSDKVR
jgi:plasmid stability protein